jgi:hypothetical protein
MFLDSRREDKRFCTAGRITKQQTYIKKDKKKKKEKKKRNHPVK